MSELILQDFCSAHQFGAIILRYFNAAGAWPDGNLGEDHDPESHLIPRVLRALRDQKESIKIFGNDYPTPDGTCIRDYVHVVDLARAHSLALQALSAGKCDIYNIGNERGHSVREVITTCEQVAQRSAPVLLQPRRPGDPGVLIASSQKIEKVLGWRPTYPLLSDIIGHAWLWHQRHPYGHQTFCRPIENIEGLTHMLV